MHRGRWVEAVAVTLALAAVVGGYMSLAWYGFDLLDEGYFLTHARRIQLGGLPYRDFDAPYTPGVFYLYAWLLDRFGPAMELLRAPAVAGRAVTLLALYLLARRLTSPFFAALPPLVILLIDRAPPYWSIHPGWIATPATLLAALAVVRYLDGGKGRWLVGAGAGIAVAFAFKQNLAAFLLMALLWLLAVADRQLPLTGGSAGWLGKLPGGVLARGRDFSQVLATLLLPLSALVLVRPYFSALVAALFVVPLVALAVAGPALVLWGTLRSARTSWISAGRGTRRAPGPPDGVASFAGPARAGPRTPTAGTSLGEASFYVRPLLVVAGFSVVTLPWLLPLLAALWGRLHLLRGFIGQVDPAGYYYGMTPPVWEHWRLLAVSLAVPLACGAAGAALGALFIRRWWERAALVGAVLLMMGGVVAWRGGPSVAAPTLTGAIGRAGRELGHAWTAYRDTWPHPTDDLVLYLPSLAFWVGLAALVGALLMRRDDPNRLVRLWYLAAGACLLLTQYPRMGYGHIVWSGGLLYVVGADRLQALHRLVVGRISPRVGWGAPRGFATVTVAATLSLLPAAAVLPYLQQRIDWIGAVRAASREETTGRPGSHLTPLAVPVAGGELRVWGVANDVRPVLGVVELLREHSEPGEPIFVYPALPGFYYLADRPNATRFNHLFAGMAGAADQVEMVRQLERVQWVVWDEAEVYGWVKPGDNAPVMRYLHENFRTAQRIGPYIILSRTGDGERRPRTLGDAALPQAP